MIEFVFFLQYSYELAKTFFGDECILAQSLFSGKIFGIGIVVKFALIMKYN